MSSKAKDIVVIGGGLIGLSIAYILAKSGRKAIVLDAGKPGDASHAAAGMLAPMAESNSLPGLTSLGLPSLRSYPSFLAELSEDAGLPIALNGPGILRIATTDEEAEALCASMNRHADAGFPMELLKPRDVTALEPSLTLRLAAAMLSPAEKHVNPRQLCDVLRAACERLGVDLVRGVAGGASKLEKDGSTWMVECMGDRIACQTIVVAAGAWTPALLAPIGITIPVTPLKGQILTVNPNVGNPSGRMMFRHTIYAHSTYLVPRSCDEILIGATEEPEAGFDIESTNEAVAELRRRAMALIPDLESASVTESRAGLRPASPDRLPIIGKIPGLENAYVASGHGRNGVLLTPATAQMVHDLILHETLPPPTVDPMRFS